MPGPRRPPARPERASASTRPPAGTGRAATRSSRSAPGAKGSSKAAKASTRREPPRRPPRGGDRSDRALARVDGPRGRRDGSAAERQVRARRRRRLVVGAALTVVFLGVLVVAVFPTRTWLDQRRDTRAAEAELATLRAERARIGAETERLGTDDEIEKEARAGGYVMPGEEAYNILPAPIDPVGLPDIWPFTGVERALGAR